MIKPAYSVSFLLSINIFVWQNLLYFLDAPRRICELKGTFSMVDPIKSDLLTKGGPQFRDELFIKRESHILEDACLREHGGLETMLWPCISKVKCKGKGSLCIGN